MQARKVDYNCRLRWHDTCYECDWRKARTLKDTRRFMCQGWKAECLLMSQKYPLGTRGNNFLKFPNALWDAIIGEFKPRSCGMWDPYCTLTPSTKVPFGSILKCSFTFQLWAITMIYLCISLGFKRNPFKNFLVYRSTKHPTMRIVQKSGTQTSYRPPTFLIGVEDYQSTYWSRHH